MSAYVHAGTAIEGHTTYGTSPQRYEAAIALRRDVDPSTGRAVGPARYLVDANTGELVITVAELQDAARRYAGTSLPHGWLDARMETIGFVRVVPEGRGQPVRPSYRPHARVYAYRGILRSTVEPDELSTCPHDS